MLSETPSLPLPWSVFNKTLIELNLIKLWMLLELSICLLRKVMKNQMRSKIIDYSHNMFYCYSKTNLIKIVAFDSSLHWFSVCSVV